METNIYIWIAFNLFVLGMLALDLGVVHRTLRIISFREAMLWSSIWICLALLFCVLIHHTRGTETALNFLAGYLIEKALSVDNLFVFLLIFSYFSVPPLYLHKILFWGVLGALVVRAIFIFGGILLIQKFHWITYLLGALLVMMGIKLAIKKENEIHPEKNFVLKLFRQWMPVTATYEGEHFFVKKGSRYWATPLWIVLLLVETTDIIFAIDSVPAILAITTDPFIVYTSNVFAILGLRSLYFALAGLMKVCYYLHYGLAILLVFIGIKMLMADYFQVPILSTLAIIASVLFISVLASLFFGNNGKS
jgi:tellurite resistance protein TerC